MNNFTCEKTECGFRTSGVVNDSTSNRRWCPKCNSPLVQCSHCHSYVSATVQGKTVVCDHCGNAVMHEYFNLTMPWHFSPAVAELSNSIGILLPEIRCTVTIDGIPYEL